MRLKKDIGHTDAYIHPIFGYNGIRQLDIQTVRLCVDLVTAYTIMTVSVDHTKEVKVKY